MLKAKGEYEFLKQYINSFTTLHDSAIVYKSYLLNEVKGTSDVASKIDFFSKNLFRQNVALKSFINSKNKNIKNTSTYTNKFLSSIEFENTQLLVTIFQSGSSVEKIKKTCSDYIKNVFEKYKTPNISSVLFKRNKSTLLKNEKDELIKLIESKFGQNFKETNCNNQFQFSIKEIYLQLKVI